MSFDILLCYMYVGIVCAVVIAIIRNRIISTQYKNTIDKNLSSLLVFFIIFCVLDAFWGITGSTSLNFPTILFKILSYIFHTMAALSSFAVSSYMISYLKISGKTRKILNIYRYILFAIQLLFLYTNLVALTVKFDWFFSFDEAGVYHSGPARFASFVFQSLQYVPFIIYSITEIIKARKDESKKEQNSLYNSAIIFMFIPVVFCYLQMLYPDGPFYSLGFMTTSITTYAFTVTSSREKYLKEFHTIETEKRSKQQILDALNKAEEANAAKTVFLSNMSHDIRTPINGIMGMTQIALKQNLEANVREYFEKINGASTHLLSLVNDVLDMSRIESGHIEIRHDSIDLVQMVTECKSIIENELVNRKINFICDFDELKNPYVYGDMVHLKQIFINILGNSVKFTPDGGKISFTVVQNNIDSNTVSYGFICSDTGIGMKQEFLKHIFDPFAQENGGSRTHYKGTGLGMPITKSLVDLMNGSLEIQTEHAVGTTFHVNLTFDLDHETINRVVDNKEKLFENVSIEGKRILVCEDNELNFEIVKTVLETEGAFVVHAEDGVEGFKAFKDNEAGYFDLILMDIMMPNLDGFGATRQIRSLNRSDAKKIPIIALTANVFSDDKKKCIEAGMDSFVPKPIDFINLINTIKTTFSGGENL